MATPLKTLSLIIRSSRSNRIHLLEQIKSTLIHNMNNINSVISFTWNNEGGGGEGLIKH